MHYTLKTWLALLTLFCLTSSFSGEGKVFKNIGTWLPDGFDSRNNILLIKSFSTGVSADAEAKNAEDEVTQKMKDEMQKLYPYKYEFVSGNQVSTNARYANTDIYRYVIMENIGSRSATVVNNIPTPPPNSNNPQRYRAGQTSGSRNFGLSVHDFHIYDRKLDKSYSPTGHPGNTVMAVFTPMINTIAEYLKNLTSSPTPLPSVNQH